MRSIKRTRGGGVCGSVAVLAASVGTVGTAYGAQAAQAGWPWWMAPLLGCAVLAASSEMVFVHLAGSGAPWMAAVVAIVLNSRNFAYGMTAAPFVRPVRRWWALAHLVNDETVALSATRTGLREARRAFVSSGVGILVSWPLGALAGSVLGAAVDPAALGLDAAFPAVVAALLGKHFRHRSVRWPLVTGAACTAVASILLPGSMAPFAALIALPWLCRIGIKQ